MPPRNWRTRIQDMLTAIVRIQRYTAGMDYDRFVADELRVDAVLRNFTIIGEVAARLPDEIKFRSRSIDWARIAAMRHIVVHAYWGVSLPIVWQTMSEDLDQLARDLQKLSDTID